LTDIKNHFKTLWDYVGNLTSEFLSYQHIAKLDALNMTFGQKV